MWGQGQKPLHHPRVEMEWLVMPSGEENERKEDDVKL
jgi:hypothetical protein|tara:strand:- start:248 stop:358 length:111 start_codon:yes stop_codon:yes gene_type:complete